MRSRLSLTDDISGAEYIDVRLISPSGHQVRFACFPYPFLPPTLGSDTNGQWDCSGTWPRYAENGTWQVQWIPLRDKALNWSYYNAGAGGICDNSGQGARCMVSTPRLTVTGSPSDVTPAAITAFEVSLDVPMRNYGPSVSLDASVSARPIVFRMHALDAVSGVGLAPYDAFFVQLLGPSGQNIYTFNCALSLGDAADGYWECPITIPQSAEVGTWKVQSVVLGDRAGNNGYYTGRGWVQRGTQLCDADNQCITPPTVTVTSAGDAEAPMLQALSLAATNADVSTTLDVSDNISGTTTVVVQYMSTTSNQSQVCHAGRTSGTALSGTYNCQITFGQFAARGQWVLQLNLYDAAGNLRYYFRRPLDGFLCYYPVGGGAAICRDFGTTDLVLQ